jgi:hypothetical protein
VLFRIRFKILICLAGIVGCVAAQAVVEVKKTIHRSPKTEVILETLAMEGGRQSIVNQDQSVIVDADAGKVYSINHATRTYSVRDIRQTSGQQTSASPALTQPKVKALDKFRTIAGYRCQIYESVINTPKGTQVTHACFADAVPGLDDYRAFMAALKKLGLAPASQGEGENFPSGLPLYSKTSLKVTYEPPKELKPEQVARFKRLLAAQPPRVTEETVTRIRVSALPLSTFEIPKGYVQLQIAKPIEE